MKLINRFLGFAAALFMGCGMVSSQTDEVVKELNERGFWFPYVTWLESDDRMESYLRNLNDNCAEQLKKTLQSLDNDHERAQVLLKARNEIGGKNKGKKQDERLSRRFNDVEAAKRAFDVAEQVESRYERLKKAIMHQLENMKPAVMPAGQLLYFSYSTGNAFACYHKEITLDRQQGKHELKVEEQQMSWGDQEKDEKTVAPKEIGDSVFQRVRNMIEQGQLYDIGSNYMPDYDITDASNWSLYIVFEQGTISSGGYAEGPDHHDTLNAINEYLTNIFKGEEQEE